MRTDLCVYLLFGGGGAKNDGNSEPAPSGVEKEGRAKIMVTVNRPLQGEGRGRGQK